MSTLVMKFGGASVKEDQSFSHVAQIIKARSRNYARTIVVASAMGDTTDELLQRAKKIHPNPPRREQDMLISAGERITISLLAMALKATGLDAISFTGSQSGIITCARHSDARIIDVRPHRIMRHLRDQKIVIVAGFQGMSLSGEITTLGRGGSDTTAVALAAAFSTGKRHDVKVEFYKDVDGIFEKDPKNYPEANSFKYLSYDKADELAQESPFLHPRSIQLAKRNRIPLHLLSFENFDPNQEIDSYGTIIFDHELSDKQGIYEHLEDDICIREGVVV
jgi:aspartate kinase